MARIARAMRVGLCLGLAGGAAGGCAVVDAVEPRVLAGNLSTDAARNTGILLNIVRASYFQPLNFVAVPKIAATTKSSVGAALPSFQIGPNRADQVTFGSATFGATANADAAYDVTVLQEQEFYKGLMTPVTAETLNLFVRQGYPRELLFWLFADSVRVQKQGGRIREHRNKPGENLCASGECFQTYVDLAIDTGLAAETRQRVVRKIAADGKVVESAVTEARLCFDQALNVRERYHPVCGGTAGPDRWEAEQRWFTATGVALDFEVRPRSLYGVYQFLGELLLRGGGGIALREARTPDGALLTVVQGRTTSCFAHVTYYGRSYCVPVEAGDVTKMTFALLAQLQALQTKAGDLPSTPVIRLTL